MGGTGQAGGVESGTDLKPLGRGQREHGLGKFGIKLVEDRFAQAGRDIAANTGDDAAHRILVAKGAHDLLFHVGGLAGNRTADRRAINLFAGNGFHVDLARFEEHVADLADPGDDLDAAGNP